MNYSFLNGGNFTFVIEDAPYLNFFVQNVVLPTMSLPPSTNGNPFTDLMVPGDHLQYDPLSVVFAVDEDLMGYQEIYHWMRGLGFPTSFDEYKSLIKSKIGSSVWQATTSDIVVTTMTGSRNPNVRFNFIDAFPSSLSAPTLTTTAPGVQTLTCTATFAYTYFDVSPAKTVDI